MVGGGAAWPLTITNPESKMSSTRRFRRANCRTQLEKLFLFSMTSLFLTQAEGKRALTGTPMDRSVARKELLDSVEAALAEVEASLSESRTTGTERQILAEIQQIVDEIRRTLRSV